MIVRQNAGRSPGGDRRDGGFVMDAGRSDRRRSAPERQASRSPDVTRKRQDQSLACASKAFCDDDTRISTPRACISIRVRRQVMALDARGTRPLGEEPAEASTLWPAYFDQAAVARARRVRVRAGDPLAVLTEQPGRMS